MKKPITAHFGRAHGLPKTHKKFDTLPTFRPIIDTTYTPHYSVGKFLSSLLNPLTLNAHSLSDSFDAVTYINNIPRHLFQEGYQFVSFDVESLFTNVPLRRTVNIILDRIYKDELITTTFKKRTLKKLILDSCSKTAFSFDEQIYVQQNGVSIGSSLGPVLANIILTEFERLIVSELIADGTIKFYKKEHATRLFSSAVGEHFSECEHAQYLVSLQNQFTLLNDLPLPSDNLSPIEILVLNNYKILHSTKSNNYNILAFLEALLIKHNKPFLNTGLKASKELQLFT